jgi:peptidoglycan/LPS O-acetylase OafA/YrhL
MPFMVNILFGHGLLEPLWSIGVEEVFYLIWAPLVKLFKNQIGYLLIAVFVCKLLLSTVIVFGGFPIQLQKLVTMLQFEAMAVGGAGAWWLFNAQKSVGSYFLFSRSVQWFFVVFLIVKLLFFRYLSAAFVGFDVLFNTPVFSDVLLQLVFCWLILNVSMNDQSIIRLDFKWLDFLGEISYGLYMYHMLIVFGLVLVVSKFLPHLPPVVETLVFYVVVTGLSIVVSFLSKRYFEDWFNAFRNKFA